MNPFINFTELYNAGGSFSKQEVLKSGSTTTIYGGYAPRAEASDDTDDRQNWTIRRLVVTEYAGRQEIVCTWARGSWTARASLDYSYYRP